MIMKNVFRSGLRRGFTLIELMVALAVTSLLVFGIMQMTIQGLDLWGKVREDVSTSSSARFALEAVAHDLESFQMRAGDNEYQWLYANVDKKPIKGPRGMKIPRSVQCIFFACAPDRNPSVSSSERLRRNYRNARSQNEETRGDVSAVGYRLLYRDHFLDISGDEDPNASDGAFPLFSLYRQVVPPNDTFDKLLGLKSLKSGYDAFGKNDKDFFLCENVLEMNVLFTIQYAKGKADVRSGSADYDYVTVPVITTKGEGAGQEVGVYGNCVKVGGKVYENARIVSANISITVLTEEGVQLAEQIRLGRRRAPNPAEFISKYTRSFSRMVSVPQPL